MGRVADVIERKCLMAGVVFRQHVWWDMFRPVAQLQLSAFIKLNWSIPHGGGKSSNTTHTCLALSGSRAAILQWFRMAGESFKARSGTRGKMDQSVTPGKTLVDRGVREVR